MRKALIIFTRKPEIGKVKTRLAMTVGDSMALEIYLKLVEHTRQLAQQVQADKFNYVTDIAVELEWDQFTQRVQSSGDLGQRMQSAFGDCFESGYQSVVIIGSDCPSLNSSLVEDAYYQLQTHDIVIGPARDGGYYLLGMKRMYTSLFESIEWSTNKVYEETISIIKRNKLTFASLPVIADVDVWEDIPASWLDN